MSTLKLYAVFHLNMAYSSIEEQDRAEVIKKCYWPLLRLIRDEKLPFGVECSGYTLETIQAEDPSWVEQLAELAQEGACTFVGSGYAQLIGPLVPATVNARNLTLGNEVYDSLLGITPKFALVNEQAYSAGMIGHYRRAGYDAILMEWDNPASAHPDWDPALKYYPQRAVGVKDEEIDLIWNKSIAFQKFQRYAHGEMELDEYMAYLETHTGDADRAFPLYGNDAEIFDYRPGRYHTEAAQHADGEWNRIRVLIERLRQSDAFVCASLENVRGLSNTKYAGQHLTIQSPAHPIPVKKQGKYNVTRWAVTGRDDTAINTLCHRIFQALEKRGGDVFKDWKTLCHLWSSDFRTHITESRWNVFLRALTEATAALNVQAPASIILSETPATSCPAVQEKGKMLDVRTGKVHVSLNTKRGLAIDKLTFPAVSDTWACGTLEHGFFEDISLGADFYTGHVVLDRAGDTKVTDLGPVDARWAEEEGAHVLSGAVATPLGEVRKNIRIHHDEPRIDIVHELDWSSLPKGSLRIGMVTLNPAFLDPTSLAFATCNGGAEEVFPLTGENLDHGEAVSMSVSASACCGVTSGKIVLRDAHRGLAIRVHHERTYAPAMVTFKRVGASYFLRVAFSMREMDETAQEHATHPEHDLTFGISIAPA